MNNFFWFTFIALIFSCNYENANLDDASNGYTEIPENTIINLYDAFGEEKEGLQKDFGFSCIINYNGAIILFDSGTNADIFKQNARALNIDLTQIDFAVASHAHFDHINGFDYLLKVHPDVKIYFPFDPFWGANMPFDLVGVDSTAADALDEKMQYFGGDFKSYKLNQTGRFWNANIVFVRENREISPGIQLVATSSPFIGYFTKYPNMNISDEGVSYDKAGNSRTSFIELPELSLSLKTNDGQILVVGCSHSTIEKIITTTQSITNDEIALVYGGYHLLPYGADELNQLAVRLKDELNVKKVAPAHCTGHLAFKILQDHFGEDYIFAGLGETVSY